MTSYVDKINNKLIHLANDGYVYEIPIQGDWIISLYALQEGTKQHLPGVNVLGLKEELPRILRDRGILVKSVFY